MPRRQNKKKRYQRYQRELERQVEELQGNREGPSEGQYYVLNLETKEKTRGLNKKQAQELWASLTRSMIFPEPKSNG